MLYKLRPGVTHVRVCDTDLLVSTRSSWEECASVRPVSKICAYCVNMLEKGKSEEDIVGVFSKTLKKKPEHVQKRIDSIFSDLYQMGFLIAVEDNNESD